MSERHVEGPLQPGDRAPNVVLDAITRDGKIALEDFRGQSPILVGLYRGLHCPFCRRHIAAQAQLDAALHEKGVESLTVVNTPIERARLYFRYHPLPNLLAASDPERLSHRAFGLPNLEVHGGRDRVAAQGRHERGHEHASRHARRIARPDEPARGRGVPQ
ncbi:peroxiredoxin [Bradyrhizobium sp. GM5.1]